MVVFTRNYLKLRGSKGITYAQELLNSARPNDIYVLSNDGKVRTLLQNSVYTSNIDLFEFLLTKGANPHHGLEDHQHPAIFHYQSSTLFECFLNGSELYFPVTGNILDTLYLQNNMVTINYILNDKKLSLKLGVTDLEKAIATKVYCDSYGDPYPEVTTEIERAVFTSDIEAIRKILPTVYPEGAHQHIYRLMQITAGGIKNKKLFDLLETYSPVEGYRETTPKSKTTAFLITGSDGNSHAFGITSVHEQQKILGERGENTVVIGNGLQSIKEADLAKQIQLHSNNEKVVFYVHGHGHMVNGQHTITLFDSNVITKNLITSIIHSSPHKALDIFFSSCYSGHLSTEELLGILPVGSVVCLSSSKSQPSFPEANFRIFSGLKNNPVKLSAEVMMKLDLNGHFDSRSPCVIKKTATYEYSIQLDEIPGILATSSISIADLAQKKTEAIKTGFSDIVCNGRPACYQAIEETRQSISNGFSLEEIQETDVTQYGKALGIYMVLYDEYLANNVVGDIADEL